MLKWFNNCETLEAAKKQYKQLCKKYHPDISGADTTEIMKEINAEFEKAFEYIKNHAGRGQNTAKTSSETPREFMDVIYRVINLNGVEVEIIGCWIWLSGNTYKNRQTISAAGFRWSKSRKMWYWRREQDAGRLTRRNMTMAEIRLTFGSEKITPTGQKQLTA